jgi:hypothetical protein
MFEDLKGLIFEKNFFFFFKQLKRKPIDIIFYLHVLGTS